MSRMKFVVAVALPMIMLASAAHAGEKFGLKRGDTKMKFAGPMAFGPGSILFIGDTQSAAVYAVDTQDTGGNASKAKYNVVNFGNKVADMLGVEPKQVGINDMAVNPNTGHVFFSVSRGRGPNSIPVLIKVNGSGELSQISLKNIEFARIDLPNPVAPRKTRRGNARTMSITDLAYVDGKVLIAGLSNEEFASNLRSIPFPFAKANTGTSVEIFHGAHGRFETRSPVRTFAPYKIGNESHIVAAYTCTPLVKFPVGDLKPGKKIRGTTIAELGNRNRPLDMVVYNKGGKDYILLANSSRGMMKINTENIANIEGITDRISGTAGLKYDTISELKGVVQLDRLNKDFAVILVQGEEGAFTLKTIKLP